MTKSLIKLVTDDDRRIWIMSRRINPYLGTKGERYPNSRLTEEDVKEIRKRYKNGEKSRILAQEFGVSQSTIRAIAAKRCWRHI